MQLDNIKRAEELIRARITIAQQIEDLKSSIGDTTVKACLYLGSPNSMHTPFIDLSYPDLQALNKIRTDSLTLIEAELLTL